MTDRFVNTAADSGGDGTTNNTSSGDGTHAYDDLAVAEAGEQADLTASESLIFKCTGTADSSRVTFALADWTVDASNFITIEPQAADRHAGTIDTAKYHKTTVANYRHGIENLVDFTVIDGIQILLNNAFNIGVDFGGCIDVVVKNCIIQGDGSSSQQRGVEHNNPVAAGQFTVVNTVVFDCSTRGIGQLQYDADLVIVYYNNTVDSCGTGIQMGSVHDAASRIFNNIATNNTTDYSLSGSFTSDNNLSSDATSPETAHQSKTVTYTDASGGDFSTSDADVVTLGTDLTSDSLFPFSTDCILVDRATSWDLGAFQEAAAGGTSPKGPFTHPFYGPFRGPIS